MYRPRIGSAFDLVARIAHASCSFALLLLNTALPHLMHAIIKHCAGRYPLTYHQRSNLVSILNALKNNSKNSIGASLSIIIQLDSFLI